MRLTKPKEANHNILEILLQLSADAKKACEELSVVAIECAKKKDALKRAEARGLLAHRNSGKSQEIRSAAADSEYAEERREFYLVEARKEVLVETIKTLRQILSAHQTYVNSEAAVANMLGYGQSKDN